jgi:hypothetical protein
MVVKQSTHQDLIKTGLPRKGINTVGNDQIATDIAKAKQVGQKVVGKVKEAISPVVDQNKNVISKNQGSFIQSVTLPTKEMFDKPHIKKILRITLMIILLLLLLNIVSLLVKTARQNGELAIPGLPTPTVVPYQPYNPSVYAEDELVLQLEEDIKVLDRELSIASLKETILTPPELDFDVNFEE